MPKISQLPILTNINTGSVIPIVDNSRTQRISVGKLYEFLSGALDQTFSTEFELMQSASAITSSIQTLSASLNTTITNITVGSASIPPGTVSSSNQITTLGFAKTGSNAFNGSQTISAGNSLLVNRIENTTGGNIEIAASGLLTLSGDGGGVTTNDNFESNPGGANTFKVSSGSVSITGSIYVSGTPIISGANQIANLGFATTSSILNVNTSSLLTIASFNQYTSSLTASVNINTSSLATTGSNSFNGSQTILAGNSLLVNRIENTTGGNIEIAASGLLSLSGDGGGVTTNDNFEANPGGNATFKVTSGSISITGSISATGTTLISSSAQITNFGFATTSSIVSVNTSSLVTTASFNSYTSSNDGKWNTLGGQTGSFITEAETGSFVTNVSMFLSKSAFDTYTGSAANAVSSAINAATSSLSSSNAALDNIQLFTSSFNTFTSSVNTFSASVNGKTGSYATTGSNEFNGNQTITGSLIHGLEGNLATGEHSHAEGSITKAIGNYSHAEGDFTQAIGDYSHAEGQETIASGAYSHAEGYQTIALGQRQHVTGQYNFVSPVQSAFIVGNGIGDGYNRSNLIYAAENAVEITGSLLISGSSEFGGNLVPKTAKGATLGTLEKPFRDIFIQSASINIQSDTPGAPNTTISNVGGNLLVSAGGMRLIGSASFIAATGSFGYLSGSFTHIGSQFNEGDTVTTGSLRVSGSTIQIGNNTQIGNNNLIGNTVLSGSVIISSSLDVDATFTASLREGYTWVGGAGNISKLVATSSFGSGGNVGGIFIQTGSIYATTNNVQISGSLNVLGNQTISGSFTASLREGYVWVGDNTGKNTLQIATSSFAITGTSGTSGTSGVNGTSGTSGTNGVSGSSGTSGDITLFNSFTGSVNNFTSSIRNEINGIEAYTASLKAAAIISSSAQITALGFGAGGSDITLLNQFSGSVNTYTGSNDSVRNRILQSTASLNTYTGSSIGIDNGLMAYTSSLRAATIFSSSAQITGNITAVGSTFSYQYLVLGNGTSQARISTDGGKNIEFYPNNGIQSVRFWSGNGVTIQAGGTYTYYGYTLDVQGTSRVTGNANVTGSFIALGGLTGSILSTNGVVSSSTQIQNYNLFAQTSSANTFYGNQTITGSLFVTSTTVSDSTLLATGSNLILNSGSNLYINNGGFADISGSLRLTGSLNVGFLTGTSELQVLSTGVTIGNTITDRHLVTGSLNISGSTTQIGNTVMSGSLTLNSGSALRINDGLYVNGNKQFNYGQWVSLQTQTGSANTAYAMKLETPTDGVSGFYVGNNASGFPTRIYSQNTGLYNLQFSAQLHTTSNEAVDFSVWFAMTGSNIAYSNTDFSIEKIGGGGFQVAALNFLTPITSGSYVELYWSKTTANGQLQAKGTQVSPTRPATPSLIVTVTQVA